ncbi:hypothetical protein [Achromobacter spanius]|uniref:Uncharacterized protein n=1 Tax=Achromobacter spanius TaxID=217203 RepID=A0A2S0ICH3_9BURK|nr:hypothetical protein [Achromobacter spanius]AVJ29735.1 hypothetical protein CLM73_23025 [Achromobacter spanius]
MKSAIHLHIRALSLPSHDAAQRNAFVAALVHELVRRAALNGGAATDANAEQVRTVADGAQPAQTGTQAGRAIADTFHLKH